MKTSLPKTQIHPKHSHTHSQNSRIISLAISLKLSNFGMIRMERVSSIYRENNGTTAPTHLQFIKVLGITCQVN